MTYQVGLEELTALAAEVTDDALVTAQSSESDTRAKVIDRILARVLAWPESQIQREIHSESGFSDYILRCPHAILVVEAKRAGTYFSLPLEGDRRSYKLTSLRSTRNGVGDAIKQARGYADDHGIEFACATNGSQWLIFRAISPGEPWHTGSGIVYRNLKDILDNFTDFWNLLSFEAVGAHSLRGALSTAGRERLSYQRALDNVLYADAPLQRNSLSTQLQPIIAGMFRDLTGQEQEHVLRNCYVTDRKVKGVSQEVSTTARNFSIGPSS